jgi:hypothetical protein
MSMSMSMGVGMCRWHVSFETDTFQCVKNGPRGRKTLASGTIRHPPARNHAARETRASGPQARDCAPMQAREDERPLHPERSLPLPTHIPSINVEYSSFYIESDGKKLVLPQSVVARTALLPPLKVLQAICIGCEADDCLSGWPSVRPNDVCVLKLRDYTADTVYGWYVRLQSEPYRLIRVPRPLIAQLFLKLHSDERLRRSSLYEKYTDVALVDHEFPFEELLRRTLVCTSSAKSKKRKRSKNDDGAEADSSPSNNDLSVPASPRRNMEDACTFCLEEVEIVPSGCCGLSGGTCRRCNDKVRGLCTLCDRQKLTCTYECECCRKQCTFEHSGFPCCVCREARVCVDCHLGFSVCWSCIEKT